MKSNIYKWNIVIAGAGQTAEEAWKDAEAGLKIDGLGSMDDEPFEVSELIEEE